MAGFALSVYVREEGTHVVSPDVNANTHTPFSESLFTHARTHTSEKANLGS